MREGGRLGGHVTIRGVERRESFVIRPATCGAPGVACDIVARGSINRDAYGMGRWGFALSDRVVFSLRVRTLPEPERSEEHTSELQSLMRISSAVFCFTKTKHQVLKYTIFQHVS